MNTSAQYHQPVLDALCAFVRDRTTRHQREGKGDGSPATDVQAAPTVICRRNPGPGRIDLTGANIEGADLAVAHLEGANLREAHLEHANLFETRLRDADLLGMSRSLLK